MRGVITIAALVFVLAIGASAARGESIVPVEGSWAGESSAGLPVHFGVASGHVDNTRFKFEWGFCGTYESRNPRAFLEIDTAGHWVVEDSRGQTMEATFVAPDRVEGTIVAVERMLPGCPRTEATFTASPVPPNPENIWAALGGVEALPYEIDVRVIVDQGVLIGRVHGGRGERFRFYLFVNRKAPRHLDGDPTFELHGPHYGFHIGLEGGKLANTDELWSTVPRRTDSKSQKRERRLILRAVADTVCVRQTGAPCPR
jgi:hypothetical protein